MSNLYSLFKQLTPDDPLYIGTVLTVDSGTARVQLPGGAVIVARGQTTVDARVFVRAGVIEGTAPNLTPLTIVI